jgi:hypothetical protein
MIFERYEQLAENPLVDDLILSLETYAMVDSGADSYEESLASVGLDEGWVAYIAYRMRWTP